MFYHLFNNKQLAN
jgi:hypothetical protein